MNTANLRELLSKATPRPWSLAPGRILTGAEYERIIRREHIHCDSDAALIVALVNNAEALLDEVERLRSERQELIDSVAAIRQQQKEKEWPVTGGLVTALEQKA